MAEREVKQWITINGQHIPIMDGESKQDAFNRMVAKKNEDTKEFQIKRNKEEADRLNGTETVRNKPFTEWRKEWKDKYNLVVYYDKDEDEGDMKNLTDEQRVELEKHLDAVYKEFPELKDMRMNIDKVDKIATTDNANPAAHYDERSINITNSLFNKAMYEKDLQKEWYAGVLTSFHPQGTNSYSLLDHEYGHAITDCILLKQYNSNTSSYSEWLNGHDKAYDDLAKSIVKDASKNVSAKATNISYYATYDNHETIAEAVSDYMANRDKANALSIEIVKELKKRLKG